MDYSPPRGSALGPLKRHGIVFALATIVGALCIVPHLYARYSTPSYAGIHLIGNDAEEHYDARIQEVRDGFPSAGDTFLPDKKMPALLPALAENVMAPLAEAAHLSTPEFAEYSKFVFPFFAALVMYAFGFLLLRSRAAALLGAATVLLGDNLISGPSAWKAFLQGRSDVSDFLTYSRPINPEFSGMLFFAALCLTVWAFFSDRTPRWYEGVAIGTIVGIAFYPSPYVASFVLCVVAIVGMVSIYRREWQRVIAALAAGITALVCLVPFLLGYYAAVSYPGYADAASRAGVSFTHAPVFGLWVFVMLLAAIFATPKRFKQARPFFLYSAIALILLLNQQIITGHVLVSEHYHWYITKPLISFLVAMYVVTAAQWLFGKRAYLRYAAYGFVIGILVLNAMEVQLVSYRAQYPDFIRSQKYAPVMAFLNTLPQREFIWANVSLSTYIPMYTSDDTANNKQMTNYLVPKSYLEEQLFMQYRLRGISAKDAPALMEQERGEVSVVVYGLRFRQELGAYEFIPEPLLLNEVQKYQALATTSTAELAKSMGITLIIWDKDSDPTWHMEGFPAKKELFSANDIFVYRIGTTTAMK